MKALLLGLLVLSAGAFAGKEGGNGGGAHVCADSVELFDFYEAKNAYLSNLRIWEVDPRVSKEEYLNLAVEHVRKDFGYHIAAVVKSRINALLAIPYKDLVLPVNIPRVNDADIAMVEQGCTYEQVANWNERLGRVYFSKSLYERMDALNQAGLIFHEVLYKLAREIGSTNSDNVRKMVAQTFSDATVAWGLGQVPQDHVLNYNTHLALPKTGMCKISLIHVADEKTAQYKKTTISYQLSLTLNPDVKAFVIKKRNSIKVETGDLEAPCSDIARSGIRFDRSLGLYSSRLVFNLYGDRETVVALPLATTLPGYRPSQIIQVDLK